MLPSSVIERAFQLAPGCGSLSELRRRLTREGYFNVQQHLAGRQIRGQLKMLLNAELKREAPPLLGSTID